MKKILLLTLIFSMICSVQCSAKSKLNLSNPSVLLLKTFNEEGRTIRSMDMPIEKVDVSADTERVKELKEKYFEECNSVNVQKNK